MIGQPKCRDCGQFCRPVQVKMIYTGWPPEPDHEAFLCGRCYEIRPFEPDPRIRPESSVWMVGPPR